MNYRHLSIEERSCIRKYYVDGLSYREIARLIGRSVSTVSREIRRNCTHMHDIPTYYPHTAQKKYLLRRSYCHRGMFHSQEVIDYIEEKLRATWSPEQIACTPCELKMPSWRTIYRWIYEKYLVNGNLKVLRWKGRYFGRPAGRRGPLCRPLSAADLDRLRPGLPRFPINLQILYPAFWPCRAQKAAAGGAISTNSGHCRAANRNILWFYRHTGGRY